METDQPAKPDYSKQPVKTLVAKNKCVASISRPSQIGQFLIVASVVFACNLPITECVAQERTTLLPKHITPDTQLAIERGLNYLVASQSDNGSWESQPDGASYPCAMSALSGLAMLSSGNTTSRGPYALQIRRTVDFLLSRSSKNGLIADQREKGHSMYGHGFSLLFLSTAFGMETNQKTREEIATVLRNGIVLTSRAQSKLGGWIYTPTSESDEGSVTVTQMQGLRAAHNAGFLVPKATIQNAKQYLEMCKTPEGGICYSHATQGGPRLPISAAAICCLYSTGEYTSPLAESCLNYVHQQFKRMKLEDARLSGHEFYFHLYASQAFYQAGDRFWDEYYPTTRDYLLAQQRDDGSWQGDKIGTTYGTAISLIILQLPYKFLPIYQR